MRRQQQTAKKHIVEPEKIGYKKTEQRQRIRYQKVYTHV